MILPDYGRPGVRSNASTGRWIRSVWLHDPTEGVEEMINRASVGWALAFLGGCIATRPTEGQVVERDSKLTGPRGKTIERSIRTERGPGFVDRQIEIKRPGGTLTRDTRIVQPGGYGPRPGYGGGPPHPRIVERDVVVERDVLVERPPLIAPFVAPFLSFSFGGAALPPPVPPPAVVYLPEPAFVAPPPVVAVAPVVPVQPVPAQPPLPPPLADALGRLSSLHHQSRRDGALTLGNLGDDRAVLPLIDRLDHDFDREVRTAAAWALGEIGDPRAGVALQRATIHDRRQEVRTAAATAYARLPRPGQEASSLPAGPQPTMTAQPGVTIESHPLARPTSAAVIDPGPNLPPPSETPPPFPVPAESPQ